jgi:hypothetical protein
MGYPDYGESEKEIRKGRVEEVPVELIGPEDDEAGPAEDEDSWSLISEE